MNVKETKIMNVEKSKTALNDIEDSSIQELLEFIQNNDHSQEGFDSRLTFLVDQIPNNNQPQVLLFFQSLAHREKPDMNLKVLLAPDTLTTYHHVTETIDACKKDAARISSDHLHRVKH